MQSNPLRRFGVDFADPALLDRALTHRSAGQANYERLEFLGDALINTAVSIELYQRYPRSPEGDLTRLRAALIRESSLAELARGIGLSDYLRMGGGELKSGGYRRDSILADTLEALVAAVYLDAGWDRCQALIRQMFAEAIDAVDINAVKDAKTRLQEWLQGRGLPLPDYQLIDTQGKDHDKTFRVACRIADLDYSADAQGRSRKSAEQAAAAAVLEHIERSQPQ
ncbi:MAG: ribonuclease III [Lysobacterales bacterium]